MVFRSGCTCNIYMREGKEYNLEGDFGGNLEKARNG